MRCEWFVAAVEKAYAFLLDRGFRRAHVDEWRGGDYCMVIFESQRMRIKLELELGIPVLYLGSLDSPLTWGDKVDDVTAWYSANGILNYLERKPSPLRGHWLPRSGEPLSLDDMLAIDAARLRQHLGAVVAAFAPDCPSEWWQSYRVFQAEVLRQAKRQFGL